MKKEPNLAVRRQQKGRRRNRFPVLILDPKFKDPTVCVREFKRAGGILRQMFVLGSGVDVLFCIRTGKKQPMESEAMETPFGVV